MQGEVGREVARTARDTIRQMDTQLEEEILLWHRAYHQFWICCQLLCPGGQEIHRKCPGGVSEASHHVLYC